MIYAPRLRREDEMCPDDDERTDEERAEDELKLESHLEDLWERRHDR